MFFNPDGFCNAGSTGQFDLVPLAIVERQRERAEPSRFRYGEGGRRIQPTTQQRDGLLIVDHNGRYRTGHADASTSANGIAVPPRRSSLYARRRIGVPNLAAEWSLCSAVGSFGGWFFLDRKSTRLNS